MEYERRPFELVSSYKPTGDQPEAIEKAVAAIQGGHQWNVILGATGTGKTFTAANIIARLGKPTLPGTGVCKATSLPGRMSP